MTPLPRSSFLFLLTTLFLASSHPQPLTLEPRQSRLQQHYTTTMRSLSGLLRCRRRRTYCDCEHLHFRSNDQSVGKSSSRPFIVAVLGAAVFVTSPCSIQGAYAFPNNQSTRFTHSSFISRLGSFSTTRLCQPTKDESSTTSLLARPPTSSTRSSLATTPSMIASKNTNDKVSLSLPVDNTVDDITAYDDTTSSSSTSFKVASVAVLLILLSQSELPSAFLNIYSTMLVEHPLPTKSLTSGILCGVSDALAQYRDVSRQEFNYGRWIRFASKGCVGGIIWSFWYDNLDSFLNVDSDFNVYKVSGVIGDGGADATTATVTLQKANYQWIQLHTAIVTTTLSILLEQFLWCPIVYSGWELPVSTLLNGGDFSTIKKEVSSKVGDLLIMNAKVWTFANVIIYNCPVAFRPAVSNIVDILWQSIVSDVAADCGKVDDDICIVTNDDYDTFGNEDVVMTGEKDYAFYAEKSRI